MKIKRNLLFLLFLIAGLLFAQGVQDQRTLRVGIDNDIESLVPWDYFNVVTGKVLWNIFEPLIAMEENSTKIRPYLATSWQASNNNKTWIIQLRQGVKFHDGSSMTADDVVASAGAFLGFDAKAEKVDQYTVRFSLPRPNGLFLNRMAQVSFSIAPAENANLYNRLRQEGKIEKFIPIGSGPFKFSKWDRGNEIIFESFPDYWQGTPWLHKIIFKIIRDYKERASALEKGDIDVGDVFDPREISRLKKNQDLRVLEKYGMTICFIALNTKRKPLDDVRVRQALNLAVDKMRLTRIFYFGGYGVPTNRVLSPAFWGFNNIPKPGKFNPAEAKRLLADAGYKDGFSLDFFCPNSADPFLADPQILAEEIKKELAFIAVNLHIVMRTGNANWNTQLRSGNYDMVLDGWIEESGSPDYMLKSLLGNEQYSYNNAHWFNQMFYDKLQAARELPPEDTKGRIQLYNEAQAIFQQEAPWIPLFHNKIYVLYNKRVHNIHFYPSGMISYHMVAIAR
jgi:peptide/nickel transport system substrate-binding protein